MLTADSFWEIWIVAYTVFGALVHFLNVLVNLCVWGNKDITIETISLSSEKKIDCI